MGPSGVENEVLHREPGAKKFCTSTRTKSYLRPVFLHLPTCALVDEESVRSPVQQSDFLV
jgi:hypothetical protein